MSSSESGRLRLLATRPQPQNERLIDALDAAGVDAVSCPLFILESFKSQSQTRAAALLGEPGVLAIFVSPAAVRFGSALVTGPIAATAVAVGAGTAKALHETGVASVLQPSLEAGVGSEAVLSMPELGSVEGRTIVIVQGDRPRGLLQEVLRDRGAKLVELSCYRRRETEISPNEFMDLCLQPAIDALLVSSLGGWRRIEELTLGRLDDLHSIALIVVSSRVRKEIDSGVWPGPVTVSNGVDAGAIVAALKALFPER